MLKIELKYEKKISKNIKKILKIEQKFYKID